MKIRKEEMELIQRFEEMTKTTVKDCIINGEDITFIVKEGQIGLAIGKKGLIINKVKRELGKEIHVYEYSDDLSKFITNLFFPLKIENIEFKDNEAKVFIDSKQKKRAIGKDGKKIRNVQELTSRHFNIQDIKVV